MTQPIRHVSAAIISVIVTPDLIQQIEDAWVFTKFDVQWGYNNI